MKPTRNAVRAVFSEEDALQLPSLEASLRRDIGMALVEGVDRAVYLGEDGANENTADIVGLATAANVVEVEISQANKAKGPETLTAFSGLVDGIHTMGLGDLLVYSTVGAWRLGESTIINSAADSMTLAAFLRAAGSRGRRGARSRPRPTMATGARSSAGVAVSGAPGARRSGRRGCCSATRTRRRRRVRSR